MIHSTLAAMADYSDDGKFDFDVSSAAVLAKIKELNATGNFPYIEEKLTVGNKIVMAHVARKLQLVADGVLAKTPMGTIYDDVTNLQSSSSSCSCSSSSCSCSSSSCSCSCSSSSCSCSSSSCSCSSSSCSSSSSSATP